MAFLNAHSVLPTHSPGCTANSLVLGQVAVLAVEFFDNKRQICAARLPYIWFQESSFRPVFDCRPISIGKFSEGLVIEVYLESTKSLPRLALSGDDGKPSFPVIKLSKRRYWWALGSNKAKIPQHHGGHPYWNKDVNITQLEFDMSVLAFLIGTIPVEVSMNQIKQQNNQGARPATATRNPPARLPGARAKEENNHNKQETSQTNLGTP